MKCIEYIITYQRGYKTTCTFSLIKKSAKIYKIKIKKILSIGGGIQWGLTHFLGPQYPAQGLTQQGTQERFLE
jgi:hypothetical protein